MNRGFSDSALVLIGHGSTLNPDSSAPTQAHARVIRERGIFHEVHSCFWKEEPSLREVREWWRARRSTLFLSSSARGILRASSSRVNWS